MRLSAQIRTLIAASRIHQMNSHFVLLTPHLLFPTLILVGLFPNRRGLSFVVDYVKLSLALRVALGWMKLKDTQNVSIARGALITVRADTVRR